MSLLRKSITEFNLPTVSSTRRMHVKLWRLHWPEFPSNAIANFPCGLSQTYSESKNKPLCFKPLKITVGTYIIQSSNLVKWLSVRDHFFHWFYASSHTIQYRLTEMSINTLNYIPFILCVLFHKHNWSQKCNVVKIKSMIYRFKMLPHTILSVSFQRFKR